MSSGSGPNAVNLKEIAVLSNPYELRAGVEAGAVETNIRPLCIPLGERSF